MFIVRPGRTLRNYVRQAKMTAVSRGANFCGFILNDLHPGTYPMKRLEDDVPELPAKEIKKIAVPVAPTAAPSPEKKPDNSRPGGIF